MRTTAGSSGRACWPTAARAPSPISWPSSRSSPEPGAVRYHDHFPAGFRLTVYRPAPMSAQLRGRVRRMMRAIKPAGVGMTLAEGAARRAPALRGQPRPRLPYVEDVLMARPTEDILWAESAAADDVSDPSVERLAAFSSARTSPTTSSTSCCGHWGGGRVGHAPAQPLPGAPSPRPSPRRRPGMWPWWTWTRRPPSLAALRGCSPAGDRVVALDVDGRYAYLARRSSSDVFTVEIRALEDGALIRTLTLSGTPDASNPVRAISADGAHVGVVWGERSTCSTWTAPASSSPPSCLPTPSRSTSTSTGSTLMCSWSETPPRWSPIRWSLGAEVGAGPRPGRSSAMEGSVVTVATSTPPTPRAPRTMRWRCSTSRVRSW